MQFSQSLKENHIFRRLYAKGNSSANRYLAVYCRKNRQSVNRVGITVSAKLGCAVVRNRIRRRLREIYRLHEQAFLPGYDLVVVARSQAVTASLNGPISIWPAGWVCCTAAMRLQSRHKQGPERRQRKQICRRLAVVQILPSL